jgi:hypothetical protein
MNTASERRTFKRADFYVSAHITVNGQEKTVQLLDFALKGARVEHEGDWQPEVGQTCHLRVELGRAATIEMDAQVLRVDGRKIGLQADQPAQLQSQL